MKKELEKYFEANTEATYENNEKKLRLVSADEKIRVDKAMEQYDKAPVPISTVVSYVNEFLNMGSDNDNINKPRLEGIRIGGNYQAIVDRAIIIFGCEWQEPVYDKVKGRYTFWDKKYNIIKNYFDLNFANDIIWIKFTEDGYLGVVADRFDINFKYDNSSGRLIRVIDKSKKWNEKFVVVFPITKDLLAIKSRKELETAIGNYLEEKGVPIIDFYSHNNF